MMNFGCFLSLTVATTLGVIVPAYIYGFPLPTGPQLGYQQREIVGLTHFNMATFFGDGDPGCNTTNWHASGNPLSFNPYLLNVSNWIENYKAIGAKSAVLTAKHGCGFTLWPTKVTIPSTGTLYNYSVEFTSYPKDIIQAFTQLCSENGLGYGFYYSLTNNFFLHVKDGVIDTSTPLLPGQLNVTQSEFEEIAIAQLTELFTNYGNLTEFWFDGGTFNFSAKVSSLLAKYQPNCAVFNGQDVSPNVVRWIGTEQGIVSDPIWSLGESEGIGDPNSTQFCPACVDTTLQTGDHWFYSPGAMVKNLSRLMTAYRDSVGNNAVLELDFAIDRTGNVAANHSNMYKQFGDCIRSCYDTPIVYTNGTIGAGGMLGLKLDTADAETDRVVIKEDLKQGQRIRKFEIDINGEMVFNSTSVGNKRIVLLGQSYASPVEVVFKVNEMVESSVDVSFGLYSPCTCDT